MIFFQLKIKHFPALKVDIKIKKSYKLIIVNALEAF